MLRCTYRAYDAVDEITAAFSIAFNPAGTKIFDIHRPGREFEQYSTLQGNKEGQAGIISTIAFCPTHSGMLATGSYNQTAAIFREDNMELLYVLHGQEGPILKRWQLSLYWSSEDMARGKGKEDARNADRGVLTGTGRGRGRGDPEIVRGRGIITTAPSSVDFRAPTLTPTTPVSYLAPAAPPLAPAADSSNA
ncbi:telomerase Cajal body protein 1-like isoform X3 [Manihot esculenta]|uniref:telomerase Cajal body protein 1-like isoform X3 n=1 Tax=Manihot esculenta TaxID=3983 RepID=UPI001CC52E83|nr:telomerase Cajal body protein 1-like isoform X3 [Manihot esculenta]